MRRSHPSFALRTFGVALLAALASCGPAERISDPVDAPVPPAPVVDEEDPPPPFVPSGPDELGYLPEGYGPEDPVLVVFIGDSISKGNGASDNALAYDTLLWSNNDEAYPDWLGRDLLSRYDSIERGVDVAVEGATTQTVLDASLPALDTWMDETWPDGIPGSAVVFMTIGGNDLQQALLPSSDPTAISDDTLARLETIVDALLEPARFPLGVTLYVTNVYEPSGGVGQSSCFFGFEYSRVLADLDAYNLSVRDLAEERGFAAVDLYTEFRMHGADAAEPGAPVSDPDDPTRWFAPDCIHPNDRGHHEIRRMMWDTLQAGSTQVGG